MSEFANSSENARAAPAVAALGTLDFARNLARGAARRALDFLYPPVCLACSAAVGEPGALCAACWRRMRFVARPICERLGTPFPADFGAGLISPQAAADPPVYGRARCVALFEDGPVRALLHGLKYGDRGDLATSMGRWMARAGAELLADADAIVPVPLHPARLWRRRFNQAADLARAISRESGVALDADALARVRPTASQVGKSRAQRAENLQGAFKVADSARPRVEGKRIVLVDDVLTSGATANAASRALLKAGAARVDALVFARVVTGT